MDPQSASATSLNFRGFEEMHGFGTPSLIYNQIFIEPNLPETAGSNAHAAAGFVPGTQSYLKQKRAIWSKSGLARELALQGYSVVH